MALTKARPPSTSINEMSFGTTNIDIPSLGADIDVNVAGSSVLTMGDSAFTVADIITMTVKNLISETINLSTTSGASANLSTNGSQAQLLSTSAHPLAIGANSVQNLIAQIDGTVTLNTTGASGSQLVTKDYVDTASTSASSSASAVMGTEGYISIPNQTGNDLYLQWGYVTLNPTEFATVTFPIAFPNSAFGVLTCLMNLGLNDVEHMGTWDQLSPTSFRIYHPEGGGDQNKTYYYLAIGF